MRIFATASDVVECLRIAKMIERHGELFLQRVFTQREIKFCSSRSAATQHYSSHWTAKEAMLKILGTTGVRGIRLHDIEVCVEANQPTRVRLGGFARTACEQLRVAEFHVSLSHCRTFAIAHVIAVGDD